MLVYASLLLEGDDRWHAVKLYMFLTVELTKKKRVARMRIVSKNSPKIRENSRRGLSARARWRSDLCVLSRLSLALLTALRAGCSCAPPPREHAELAEHTLSHTPAAHGPRAPRRAVARKLGKRSRRERRPRSPSRSERRGVSLRNSLSLTTHTLTHTLSRARTFSHRVPSAAPATGSGSLQLFYRLLLEPPVLPCPTARSRYRMAPTHMREKSRHCRRGGRKRPSA